jgi:3-hydroxypropanoate dehydrogenase
MVVPDQKTARCVDGRALDIIFRAARSHNGWLDEPVDETTLRQLFDIMRLGPTSANCSPARIIFLRSREAKERLRPAMSRGNLDKTMAAPVSAIVGYDLHFYERLDYHFPHDSTVGSWFTSSAELARDTAFRNGSLQGAYFIIAARALGLDAGPLSGFDNAKVDAEFFAGTTVRSNFICNLGYGDPTKLYGRLPRFEFDEVCKII